MQRGSLAIVSRKEGPAVWQFRWSEKDLHGGRVQRKRVIPAHILDTLAENDEDVKTVQLLMRHANSNITMNIYTHVVSSKKRRAQSKVVKMILPEQQQAAASAGVA